MAVVAATVPLDSSGIWRTNPRQDAQVELRLERSGRFESREYWMGPETKPVPTVWFAGTWNRLPMGIRLDVASKSVGYGQEPNLGSEQNETRFLPLVFGRMRWKTGQILVRG